MVMKKISETFRTKRFVEFRSRIPRDYSVFKAFSLVITQAVQLMYMVRECTDT